LNKNNSLIITSLSLALITTTVDANKTVDVPEVSGPPTTLKQGEIRKTKRIRDGKEEINTARLLDDKTIEVSRDDGCSYTRSNEDRYGPNLTWTNCSSGKWGSGKVEDIKKEGQLWPFKVGNKVSYKYTAINSKGKKNKKAFRNCEVTGTELATASGKEYPSYKIECKEHSGDRTYWYAPELETTAFYIRNHKKKGKTVAEFVERIQ
jgi:hypothetical protein